MQVLFNDKICEALKAVFAKHGMWHGPNAKILFEEPEKACTMYYAKLHKGGRSSWA